MVLYLWRVKINKANLFMLEYEYLTLGKSMFLQINSQSIQSDCKYVNFMFIEQNWNNCLFLHVCIVHLGTCLIPDCD